MIRVTWSFAILFPMFFCVGVVTFCALYYAVRSRLLLRKKSRDRIYRCTVCEHVYVDARFTGLARCPRCGCLNEPVRT